MRGIKLFIHRPGISDCTGNLPFDKNKTNTKQVQTRIFATLSLNQKERGSLVWIGHNTFLGKVTALRILVGLARAVRRQIGNTVLGGCNRRPLEKLLPSKFCLFGAAPSRESFFFKQQVRLLYCDRLRVQNTYAFFVFIIYTFILCQYIFLLLILNQRKLCLIG